jgi:predicted nuclease of predicted toxin-antitoxin system
MAAARVRIYTDESVSVAVAEGLKRRGVDAWSARDAGNLGLTDEEQLEYAIREQAIIFTHDDDFLAMVAQGQHEHFGVIYVHQQDLSLGECIRRLKAFAETHSREELRNRIIFL